MRVGTVGYATRQGIGLLVRDFYDHKIVDDVVIWRHPHYETHPEWYPDDTPVLAQRPFHQEHVRDEALKFAEKIDVLLCFETPFDWSYLKVCRDHGVRTVLVPMYEWTPEEWPAKFDRIVNPSLLDQQYFPEGTFIPIPVPTSVVWSKRSKARRFLHNAGHIGSRNHKGTEELMRAMEFVESPIQLTIRCQDGPGIDRLCRSVPKIRDDHRVEIVKTDLSRSELFRDHDVYVAPEKYNGLSLPLQEAHAAGLAVMTTDRFPMNSWLPTSPMIPAARYDRVRVARGYREIDEAVVHPRTVAETIDEWYDQDISLLSELGRTWAEENSWAVLGPRWRRELERP